MPDVINGAYELLGGFFVYLSIAQLRRDRRVAGVHWGTTLFFASWGYWNLYYYPYLGQRWSAAGAGLLAVSNTIYLGMLLYYRRLNAR